MKRIVIFSIVALLAGLALAPVDTSAASSDPYVGRWALTIPGGGAGWLGVSEEGVVSVQLVGACRGCPMSTMTLKMGIERTLRDQVPGVTSVESV